MRNKPAWLILTLVFLISVTGSPCAFAHSSERVSVQASSEGEQARFADGQSGSQASAVQAVESGTPCDCPGGHCACNVDCIAMCAAVVATADTIALDFFPARLIVAPAEVKFRTGWAPNTDLDPPRPIA